MKLHASILDNDEFVFDLDRAHVGTFALMLALAGRVDEDGRLGKTAAIAQRLGMAEADLDAAVVALGGRITVRKGELYVRDWAQWQPPTTSTERARKSRSAPALTEVKVTKPKRVSSEAATLRQRNALARRASYSNSNSSSVSEEGESEGEGKPKPPPAMHVQVIEAVAELIGYEVPIKPNLRAAKDFIDDGYTVEDAMMVTRYLLASKWWQENVFQPKKPLRIVKIHENIGAARARSNGKVEPYDKFAVERARSKASFEALMERQAAKEAAKDG